MILPSSLQSLAFGDRFNQSLERVTLPSSLQSLSFGFEFNQSLKRVSLPSSLQCLNFCFSFDRSLYSKLEFCFFVQPKPGAGELAIESSKLVLVMSSTKAWSV